jgi:hypothetical protein
MLVITVHLPFLQGLLLLRFRLGVGVEVGVKAVRWVLVVVEQEVTMFKRIR